MGEGNAVEPPSKPENLQFKYPRAVLCAVFLLLALIAFGAPSVRAGHTDFLSFYAGGKLVGTPHLYSPEHAHLIQRVYTNPEEVRAFIRPPFQAALLWPLARLEYRDAAMVWQFLNLLAFAGFLRLWRAKAGAAVACCLFFPAWLSFASGQDIPILLFLFAVSARQLEKRNDISAGLVMSLCAMKFHMLALLPLLILNKRLWKFSLGFAAGIATLTASCYLVAARDWPVRYLEALKMNERMQDSTAHMPNLMGLMFRLPGASYWIAAGSVLVAAGFWIVARRCSLKPAMALMLLGGVLVGLHAFLPDCMLVLPLLLTVADDLGTARAMRVSGLVGTASLALTVPAMAFIGQAAFLGLFAWVFYESRFNQRFGKLHIHLPSDF